MGGGAVYVKALITLVQSIRLTVTVLKVFPSARWAVLRAFHRPTWISCFLQLSEFELWLVSSEQVLTTSRHGC